MEKYALYPGRRADGRPNVHLVEPGTAYGLNSSADLEKTASGEHLPQVIELVESLKAQPGRLYLVNSALGAGEYVGFNLRGDWFTEKGMLHTPPNWDSIPVWDIDARRQAANWTENVSKWGDLCWGFPTFYNAHRFRHHQNKDPNRAYGFVLGAFWDPRMHRVILVSELIEELCQRLGAEDLYRRIKDGEFPDTSMGAKVPFDRCSICSNLSKSPSAYCKHVHVNAQDPYGMRAILSDGRMCGVYNDYPRFFDDSYVFIGAERSAKVMSNFTDKVNGSRFYTQRVYSFTPPMKKTAGAPLSFDERPIDAIQGSSGWGDKAESEAEQKDARLGAKVKGLFAIPRPDDTLEDKLSRLLSGLPLSNPREREIVRYLNDKKKAEGKLKGGQLSEREFGLFNGVEKRRLAQMGISTKEIDSTEQNLRKRVFDTVHEKSASTKWADIFKSIPAPSREQLSIIKSHDEKMPDLPDKVLDYIAADPGPRIRAAGRLGVVLRPHEFQYSLLKGTHPGEAEEFKREGKVFRPGSLLNSVSSEGRPAYDVHAPVPEQLLEEITRVIGDFLKERSLAPAAVRIRMVKITHPVEHAKVEEKDHPLLEKVSSLYNEYRGGLLARPPDWRYVPVGFPPLGDLVNEEKLATASQELSSDLLHLAYWPALPVG